VPFKKLTAAGLAAAIDAMVNDGGMRQRARALGEKICAEDGLGAAVKIVERLGAPG
jgi:UDP:flavonoid glycosyltransferase YjiC (YdhE family)